MLGTLARTSGLRSAAFFHRPTRSTKTLKNTATIPTHVATSTPGNPFAILLHHDEYTPRSTALQRPRMRNAGDEPQPNAPAPPFALCGYCFMPDHVHVIIFPEQPSPSRGAPTGSGASSYPTTASPKKPPKPQTQTQSRGRQPAMTSHTTTNPHRGAQPIPACSTRSGPFTGLGFKLGRKNGDPTKRRTRAKQHPPR